jgi:hypothetical protein
MKMTQMINANTAHDRSRGSNISSRLRMIHYRIIFFSIVLRAKKLHVGSLTPEEVIILKKRGFEISSTVQDMTVNNKIKRLVGRRFCIKW